MTELIVLIPHYNDIEGLNKSLRSISPIEPVDVLIVDDGSKIKPDEKELRKTYKNINNIIVILSNPNKGQPVVQNIGLKYIQDTKKYKYVARLDSGDTCFPERFIVQKSFFLNNPDVFLVGTHAQLVDTYGTKLFIAKMPLIDKDIKKIMHAHSCFIHSSVMFRIEAIDEIGYYPLDYYANDDISYWFKFINRFQTANIDKCLITYEVNLNSLSRKKYRKELRSRIRVLFINFSFRYFIFSIKGLVKAFICYSLGVKYSYKIALFLNKSVEK